MTSTFECSKKWGDYQMSLVKIVLHFLNKYSMYLI